jgi:uncharacterized protein with NAD-binding domain and iron-sulfur cluster
VTKRKIAILGGGMGALAAAWQLTRTPELRDALDVTVYQQGWRLGGKGASGRDQTPGYGQRILEHGLHVWGGFYENAFAVMRECYAEARRPAGSPLSTWYDPARREASAFWPQSHITVEEQVGDRWVHWSVEMPDNDDLPGEGDGEEVHPWELFGMMIEVVTEVLQVSPLWQGEPGGKGLLDRLFSHWSSDPARPARSEHARKVGRALANSLGAVSASAEAPGVSLSRRIEKALADVGGFVEDAVSPGWFLSTVLSLAKSDRARAHEHAGPGALLDLLMQLHDWLARRIEKEIELTDALRRLWVIADLGLAHARGMVADGVIVHGYEVIDHLDWSAWLKKHGASDMTLESPLVRGIYDYVFGFVEGDVKRRALEAGTAVRGLLWIILTYRGAIFWEMQSGMGDAIFAPLYEVLAARGVKFAFFHRVRSLGLSADRSAVERVKIGVQATVRAGANAYAPLIGVGGAPCWPDRPRYEQLLEGERLERERVDLESAFSTWHDVREIELERGKDFDDVVLGIAIGALPALCTELAAAEPRWKAMFEAVKTVQTQAMQLWLSPDKEGLGWKGPTTVLSAYAEPYATWGDLSHLERVEAWPAGQVGSIAYFCGPLPTTTPDGDPAGFAARAERVAKSTGRAWLDANIAHLWPSASGAHGLDWAKLVDPQNRTGEARFDAQYFRANVNPSDAYVLSVPGSGKHRLEAGDTGFANLVIAGDWVKTRVNAGCIEAATLAGMAAADALVRSSARSATLDARLSTLDSLPRYVERGGEQVYRQPLELYGCEMRGFAVEADMAALRRLCDVQLNGPARGKRRYVPIVPRVMLAFAAIDRATSADPTEKRFGWIEEIDVAFWVPVAVLEPEGGKWRVTDVAWHLPYVFVDNPWAVMTGREIYGFHKQLGEFTIPSPGGDGAYRVRAMVLPRHEPGRRAEVRTVLDVRRPIPGPAHSPTIWQEAGEALQELRRAIFGVDEILSIVDHLGIDGVRLAVHLLDYLGDGRVPMVFLKQFRDAGAADRACYQRIVHACARIHEGSFRGAGPMLGDYRLQLADWASHPIAAELGLKVGENPVDVAMWTKFSFTMEAGATH